MKLKDPISELNQAREGSAERSDMGDLWEGIRAPRVIDQFHMLSLLVTSFTISRTRPSLLLLSLSLTRGSPWGSGQ